MALEKIKTEFRSCNFYTDSTYVKKWHNRVGKEMGKEMDWKNANRKASQKQGPLGKIR